MTSTSSFNYQVGGSLPADAPSYVERQCDRDYYDLLKERKYCYVFNCRQMGKSSLRVRVTHKLQAEGIVCATIDPQKIGVEVTCEQWYASAIRSLVGDLDLKSKFDLRSWIRERELLSPVQRFAEFIETVVLQEIDAPIVIFVEEIDRLLSLKFGMDDFFGLVRSFFEDRPTKPDYNRLTFSFLGVATPTDLIQSHNTSAFNIGYAVEMAGFKLTEALPLMQGLASKVANPQDYLEEALKWTGGQPFLIQRLLGMIEKELAGNAPHENIAVWVENLVQERIVTNWESQDAPPHLTTIRDRVISVEEKLRGRMLGCYQQVLADGALEDDRSEERSKLRLTGLVVRRDGRLISYNPIYAAVFNNKWVEGQLADLRPEFYASAFRAWQDAEEGQNQGFLLRGKALEEAEVWARGKRLSDVDEQFLRESRKIERVESNLKLEAEQQAREIAEEKAIILGEAKLQADRRVLVGSGVLAVTLLLAAVAGVWATKFVNEANVKVADTRKDALAKSQKADQDVRSAKTEAGEIAKKADEIKALAAKAETEAKQSIKEALTKKEEADRNVEEAQKNLELAKADAERVSQESAEKVAAAQSKIADAEGRKNAALAEQAKAALAVKVATDDIKIADIRLKILDAKGDFQGELAFEALLKAVSVGQKLKALDPEIAKGDKANIQMLVTANLSRFVYGVQEKNRIANSSIVRSVAFSPDGKTIATGSWDNTVKLWNLEGKEIQTLKGHSASVLSVAFSPDGKTIATGSGDKTVKLWNLEGKEIQTLKGHGADVSSVAFSPDGKTIATGSGDKTVKLWNLEGKEIQTLKGHGADVSSVAFSPDGKTIATSGSVSLIIGDSILFTGSGDKTVKLWNLEGKEIQTLKGHGADVSSVAFSPDGKTIATGSGDTTVKLWNLEGKEIQTLKGHGADVSSVAFSPDGKMIATGSWDKTIKLWNLEGKEIQTLKGHSAPVSSVAFSPDSKTIASGSRDNTVKLWNLEGKEIQTLKGHDSYVLSVAFSPNGKTIASGSGNISLRDNSMLLTDMDDTVKLWNLEGKEIQTLKGHSSSVLSVAFSPDGKTIATGSMDNTVKLWNLEGKEIQTLKGHDSYVLSVAFSPDGKTIATGSGDKTVKLRNLEGKEIQTLKGHSDSVWSVAFSPDGKTIATGSRDKTVKLWNLEGKEIQTLKGHSDSVWSVAFSPDGKTIASGSSDKTVKLWSIDGKELQTLKGHSASVWSVAFSPDGKTIATGSRDKTVKLWNLEGKEIQTLKGHGADVSSVAFSPDGKTIASGSEDKTVKLWNLNFDDLMAKGCAWLHDYLVNNPNASDEDRQACGIAPRQK
jgi:WD40 repeat protein